jgi:hypothetical protein
MASDSCENRARSLVNVHAGGYDDQATPRGAWIPRPARFPGASDHLQS